MDLRGYNREAWDREVERGNEWTVSVREDVIEAVLRGQWEIVLTNTKLVPREWFPDLEGVDVLCLASGGGQQAPIFAAAGANVTVLDNLPRQLAQDRFAAERDSLVLKTVEGDMADLSMFAEESFDLVFHPVSNLFVPEVHPVLAGAFRVVRPEGVLFAGFINPACFIFDRELADRGELRVRHALPHADATSLSEEEQERQIDRGELLEFSHTLEDQFGGQLEAEFVISGLYEDRHRDDALAAYRPTCIATKAIKP